MSDDKYVSVDVIAKLYGVDVRTVQLWALKAPGIIKKGRGQYNLLSVVRAVYDYQKSLIANRGDGTIAEKKGVKLDRDIHLLDLEIADKEKKFVDAIDLEKSLGKVFVEFKNIRLIPRSYAAQLSGICQEFITGMLEKRKIKKYLIPAADKKKLTVQIESLLVKQIDKALESLSRGFDPKGKKWRG